MAAAVRLEPLMGLDFVLACGSERQEAAGSKEFDYLVPAVGLAMEPQAAAVGTQIAVVLVAARLVAAAGSW